MIGQEAALRMRNVSASYGRVRALDEVALDLVPTAGTSVETDSAPGTICGLIGVNGSGKSTLLKVIMGMVPYTGSVEVFGRTPGAMRRRSQIAYMPQSEDIDWDFPISVAEVVMQGRYRHQGPLRRVREADRKAVQRALARTDLTDLAARQIGELSGGQRKRVFLARALVQEARLLLLDEPFSGVDKTSQATISEVLVDLRDRGVVTLIATHDLAWLEQLCDQAILFQRRPLLIGPPSLILEPANLALVFGGAQ